MVGYVSNTDVLRDCLERLDGMGLLKLHCKEGVAVATLTAHGQEVAADRAVIEGVGGPVSE